MDGAVAFPRRLLPQPVQVARRHAVPDARHPLAVGVIGVVLRPGGAGDLLEEAFVVPEICRPPPFSRFPLASYVYAWLLTVRAWWFVNSLALLYHRDTG
jgi:hypothetical protein